MKFRENIKFAIQDTRQIKKLLSEAQKMLSEGDVSTVGDVLREAMIRSELFLIATADIQFR